MWSVCIVPGKTSFTNKDDAVQALKKMNEGHKDKGVDKEDNAEVAVANEDNDKVAKATEDKEKETVPDAEAKGGGNELDGDGIAVWSGAGEGVMEPNGDGDRDLQTMDRGLRPDWCTVPNPLGEEALPLVGEVYGWLCWANQGTTRGLRNRPFDAVLLRRDGGNREVPPGGWAAPEDHERVLRSVIRAAWPDREPTWPAFLEGEAVLRITDADTNNWPPRALRSALAHWRYRRRNPPPPQPQPPHKRRRR